MGPLYCSSEGLLPLPAFRFCNLLPIANLCGGSCWGCARNVIVRKERSRIYQCCGSGFELDPYLEAFWIRIRIRNVNTGTGIGYKM